MKRKSLILILAIFAFLIILAIPNRANAAVSVTRTMYSATGMRFQFTGLTLDTTHEYEFGLTSTSSAKVETWNLITNYTANEATVNIGLTTSQFREVFNATDTGYITIKDKTTDTTVVEPYAIDLKIPYMQVTNYAVLNNGKEFGVDRNECIQLSVRNKSNSKAFYQFEKITDTNIINQYKKIKANHGDFLQLQSILKQTPPTANWSLWNYWNGHGLEEGDGYGYTQRPISVPDEGLYYMWLYFSGNDVKDVYGLILVDNLQPEIEVQSISLPKTKKVELGKSLTLTPTFNPSTATNKIVTWTSSNETVATVSNAGKITPKKVGSTIITVTTQNGKKATCTVTVTAASSDNNTNNENNNNGNNNTNTGNNSSNNNSPQKDNTTAPGKLPQTGISYGVVITIIAVLGIGIVAFKQYRKYKDI